MGADALHRGLFFSFYKAVGSADALFADLAIRRCFAVEACGIAEVTILQQGGNGFFLFLPGFLVLFGFFAVGSKVFPRGVQALVAIGIAGHRKGFCWGFRQGKKGICAVFADGSRAFLFELRDQCRIGFDLRSGCDGAECAEENVGNERSHVFPFCFSQLLCFWVVIPAAGQRQGDGLHPFFVSAYRVAGEG